ncbi:PBSX family phage terminase large subunit [Sphingomicrobium sp. XHP0235]|uniref:PBSX family phage terminase large subunit n=1 Tax=Sphingomicrobium aquimarinum TaxID=3133971 RepID=UPI0031FED032
MKPSRYKGAHGGRGSGKSHHFATMLVARALGQAGFRAACVREVQKSLKHSVKLLVEDKIRTLGVSSLFNIKEAEIGTPGGGVIIFQGMQNHTADSIKSLEGFDVAWVEEAQSLSQRSLDLLRPTFRKAGSELWFSWNPKAPDDPVDTLLRGESPPANATVVEANWQDNPWLPEELKEEQEGDKARDPDKWHHVWGGGYSLNSEARVFRNWKIEAFDTPKDVIHRFGADWGFAVDPTVLVRCFIDGRKLYVDAEAWKVGCEIDHTPALFETIEGSRKSIIRADSARPETVSYMKRQGFRIKPAIKGQGSIEDGVEFLRSFDIIVHPRCEKVIKELTLYAFKVDEHTGDILPALEDKNNHTIDALRYALEELRRSGYKPGTKPSKPKRDRYERQREEAGSWKTM